MTAEPIELKTKSSAPRKPSLGYVLIVDDEEQNRTLLRDPLEAKGYELGEAENGEEALRMIAARVPDVILLDVMMPRLDGFETCRRLKLNPATASVPILMVTALSERKERLMGIQCGANDFLTKPVDFQDVVLRVGNAAYTKRLFDQLQAEREKSEQLLLNVIPAAVCKRMKNGEVNIADSHAEVSVLFADLVGFTTLSSQIDADQVVFLLNEIFSEFDLLAEKHGVEKIKTIGDGYLAAGGVPVARPDHAEAIADLALDMQAEIARINHDYNTSIHIRVGISSGPVVAGVIGRKKFAYDIWGATVNLAHELETEGAPGRIRVSESSKTLLEEKFTFERCASGLPGEQAPTYWLCGRR
jgi:adenylate cyclase